MKVRPFPFVLALQLAALFTLLQSRTAEAEICGGITPSGQWECSVSAHCYQYWRTAGQEFPDRASCLKRSSSPAQSAKTQTIPSKTKVAQPSTAKKLATKLARKSAEPQPAATTTTLIKKDMARLNPETDQAEVVPQPPTPTVKQDRNVEPSAIQEPVKTAKLTPEIVVPPVKKELGRRIALVIGNSHYTGVPVLNNPAPDAKAIAKTLQGLGFEKVTLKLDLDRQSTWSTLAEFSDDAARADWAVIYYAGHGIELDGQNYIIPVDAKLETDRRVLFETVPLDHVVEATAGARKFRLVILDACRNNPFLATMTRVASSRSIGRGLTRVEPQGGVLVAYAAKAGEVALDGDPGNSPFVTALIEELNRPGVEVGFLFRKVRDSVLDMTNGAQEPYTYGSLPGREELYFKPPVN